MVVVAPVSTSPELSSRPQRRTYTAKDKLRILTDVDHAAGTGATGAILRREGQYHSNQGWQQAWGAGQTDGMPRPPDPHHRHLFPAEIISYAVWLYHVFSLSLRDVELILAERGVAVSYETVRRWSKKFAANFADRRQRRRPRPGDKWHASQFRAPTRVLGQERVSEVELER